MEEGKEETDMKPETDIVFEGGGGFCPTFFYYIQNDFQFSKAHRFLNPQKSYQIGCCFARSFLRSPKTECNRQWWFCRAKKTFEKKRVLECCIEGWAPLYSFLSQTNCGRNCTTKPAGRSSMDNFTSIPTRIGATEYDTTCDIICPYLIRYETIPTLHMIQHVTVWHGFTVLETSTLLNGIYDSMTCIQSYQFSTHEPSFCLQVHWLKTRWWFHVCFII